MKPIFTIHAGEYLVGERIEREFPECEIWLPAKDDGTDLLVTNRSKREKNIGIQVKFSKDYIPASLNVADNNRYLATGWWSFNAEKIKNSNADFWIIALYSFEEKAIQCIIIKPDELFKRLLSIHNPNKSLKVYFGITKDEKCFETRGLEKAIQNQLLAGDYRDISNERDFTPYLNNWDSIRNCLQ